MKRILFLLLIPVLAYPQATKYTSQYRGGQIDTILTQAQYVGSPVWNVANAPFNATGDGTTDDYSAIKEALDSAVVHGGDVYLPYGSYATATQIVIPGKVCVIGAGRGDWAGVGTTIKALASFPDNTAIVHLGDTTSAFGCRLENLTVDCGSNPGSIGVLMTHTQEQSGVVHCLITAYKSVGIQVGDSSYANACQNSFIEDVECYADSGATNTTGIAVYKAVAFRGVHGATLNPNGTGQQSVGISINASGGLYEGIHIERHTTGILIGEEVATDGVSLNNIDGHTSPTVTQVVKISGRQTNQNISLQNIIKGASTYALIDSVVYPDSAFASSVGFHFIGNGSGTNKTRITSDAEHPSRFQNSLAVNGSLQVNDSIRAVYPVVMSNNSALKWMDGGGVSRRTLVWGTSITVGDVDQTNNIDLNLSWAGGSGDSLLFRGGKAGAISKDGNMRLPGSLTVGSITTIRPLYSASVIDTLYTSDTVDVGWIYPASTIDTIIYSGGKTISLTARLEMVDSLYQTASPTLVDTTTCTLQKTKRISACAGGTFSLTKAKLLRLVFPAMATPPKSFTVTILGHR